MALEEVGVKFIAQGAAAFDADMKTATTATDKFVQTTDKGSGIVSKAGGMMGSAIKTVASIAAGAGVAGFLAFGKALVDGVGDAKEAAGLLAQTNAVIASTGSAAGRSANQITDLATALSASAGKSLFGDSDVQAAENLLLTFTNLKGAVFDSATAISVDMAQALGGAPKDQAIALGKALNDPIKGITALTRVGVTFSDEQKDQIKTMQEAGDVAGAQTVILNELNKEFGGSAEAAAKADGGWAQFKDTMGELEEALGAAVLPLINMLVGVLNDSVIPIVSQVVDAFGGFVETITTAEDPVGVFVDLADQLSPVLGSVVAAIGDFISGGGDFGLALDDMDEGLRGLNPLLDGVIDGISAVYMWFLKGGTASIDLSSQLVDLSDTWDHLLYVIQDVAAGYMDVIQAVLPVVQTFIANHGAEIQAFFKKTWDSIIQIVNLALELYDSIVPPILHAIAGFINEHGAEIQRILSGAWTIISALITGTLETIKGVIKLALDLIHGNWAQAWEDVKNILNVQITAIKAVVSGFFDAITGIFNTSLSDILHLWEHNWEMAKEIVGKIDWAQVGNDVINGIVQGVEDNAGKLLRAMEKLAEDAWDAIKKKLGISSPSTVFASVGMFMVQGIEMGFANEWPNLVQQVSNYGADLAKQATSIAKDAQSAIAAGFTSVGTIDRQIADNLSKIGEIKDAFMQAVVTQDLAALQKKAQAMYPDPKQAAAYFKLVSDQEFETLKIREQIAAATTQMEKDRLTQQLKLISDAQRAEENAFQATNQPGGAGAAGDLIAQIQALVAKLNSTPLDDAGIQLTGALLTWVDRLRAAPHFAGGGFAIANQPHWVGENGPELFIPSISGTVMPAASSAQLMGGGQSTVNNNQNTSYNMPVYTNQSPAALQQSMAVMRAGMI